MLTILDIDLDFFVTPIKHWGASNERLSEDSTSVESVDSAIAFLEPSCGLPREGHLPGACFEHHDALFDYAATEFKEPIRLVHLDAHADIGGGFTSCWSYVCTEYLFLSQEERRRPKRGGKALNCGNFIIFMAACGLLEEVTFVSHPNWEDDYNGIYMRNFDPLSGALQLKKFETEAVKKAGICTPLYHVPHKLDAAVPFTRISRNEYQAKATPDMMFITRSPGYTPASADHLYDAISARITTT